MITKEYILKKYSEINSKLSFETHQHFIWKYIGQTEMLRNLYIDLFGEIDSGTVADYVIWKGLTYESAVERFLDKK